MKEDKNNMTKKYKQYEDGFKRTLVDLINSGKAINEVSREYGVPASTIRQWIKLYSKIETSTGENYDLNEILKLKKELATVKEECEILKKALTIFAHK